MDRIILAALLIFITPFIAFSQAPGYLGKRAAVVFNLSSFPAFNGPTQNNRGINEFGDRFGESENGLAFNYEFDLEFSYAVGRVRGLSLGFGQYYTGAITKTRTVSRPNPFSTGDFVGYDRHELFNRVNVRSINLMYHKFNADKGALAPMGISWSIGLKYLFIKGEIVDKKTNYDRQSGELFGHNPLKIPNKANFYVLKFAFQNTQIIKDRFIFKTGIRIGLPLASGYLDNIGNNLASNAYATSTKEEEVVDFEFPIYRRLFFHEIFRFDLGVGLLLF